MSCASILGKKIAITPFFIFFCYVVELNFGGLWTRTKKGTKNRVSTWSVIQENSQQDEQNFLIIKYYSFPFPAPLKPMYWTRFCLNVFHVVWQYWWLVILRSRADCEICKTNGAIVVRLCLKTCCCLSYCLVLFLEKTAYFWKQQICYACISLEADFS